MWMCPNSWRRAPKRATGQSLRPWPFPKRDIFKLEQGRYGPIFPKTPANYGFTIIAKIKPGREEAGSARTEKP